MNRKHREDQTAVVAAASSSVIFIAVIAVIVVAGSALILTSKYRKPTEEQVQRHLEAVVESYMKNNLRNAEVYVPVKTEVLVENMVDARPTMEMETTQEEYNIVAAGIRSKLDNPQIKVESYENEIATLDSLEKVIKLQRQNNRKQDGWILQHDYTVSGRNSSIWLICDQDRTQITGVARDFILTLLKEAKRLDENAEAK